MSKKHTIEFVKNVAAKKNVTLLSTHYVNQKQKLEFSCQEGHKFEKTFDNMLNQNQGCPKCSKNLSEEICRFIFENTLKAKFEKCRLKYKDTTLELDGYNSKLEIAFEYNGRQHYEITSMTKNKKLLEHRQFLDNLKVEYCKLKGINLIVIPYTIKNDELLNYITRKLNISAFDLKIQDFIDNFSYTKLRKNTIKQIITEKGGDLLSFTFDKVHLRCQNGHIWETKYYIIKNGHWCRVCSRRGIKQKEKSEDFLNKRLIEIKNKLKKHSIVCTSEPKEYKNCRSTLTFTCPEGHTFYSKVKYLFNRIKSKNRKICPHCLYKNQQKAFEKLKDKGFKLLEPNKYSNRHEELEWVCTNGHIQQHTLKNLMQRVVYNNSGCNFCLDI